MKSLLCMKILFCGGGTLGPVTPLLAVARHMLQMRSDLSLAWAGTPNGPEVEMVKREGMPFFCIPVAKFSRHPSLRWLTWPRNYVHAQRAARQLLDEMRPDLVVGAGGFTQVPVMRSALKRSIPCAIHQLDAMPTYSNRIVAKHCLSVTTSFRHASPPFGRGVHTNRVSTPCRFANVTIPDEEAAASYFFLDHTRPIIFVFGGGTGAVALNRAIDVIRTRLSNEVQFINATGVGRGIGLVSDRRTVVKERMDERDMLFAYAAADVVVCRAGIGTLADLATLSKPAIVVPIPDSHQEMNAHALKEGIEIVKQGDRFEENLERTLTELLDDPARRLFMGETLHRLFPTDTGSELAERWLRLTGRTS